MATVNIGPDITIIPGVRYQDLRTTYTGERGHRRPSALGRAPTTPMTPRFPLTTRTGSPTCAFDTNRCRGSMCGFRTPIPSPTRIISPSYRVSIPRNRQLDFVNNYQLNPSRSTNYDAYVSFYDNSIGLLTVGVFSEADQGPDLFLEFLCDRFRAPVPYYPPYLASASAAPSGSYNVLTYVNDPFGIDDWGMELRLANAFLVSPHPAGRPGAERKLHPYLLEGEISHTQRPADQAGFRGPRYVLSIRPSRTGCCSSRTTS